MAGDTGGVRTTGQRPRREGRHVRHNRVIARRRLLRLGALALAAGVVAATVASSALAALFFLFKPTVAEPGDLVTIRLGGTPSGFTLADREKPLQRPIRLYLVPNDAGKVRSRFDLRLHFVGVLVPDRKTRGGLTFTVPPLDSGTYALASWCPGCARFSSGRSLFVHPIPEVSRYRNQMGLSVQMPPANETCPVTTGPYGNGLLSVNLSRTGDLLALTGSDGTLFQKLLWLPHNGLFGDLTVRGERLDAPGRLRAVRAFWGHSSAGRWSWMSPVAFPSEGCWRITGRVGDVSLTYVARVVAG